jgi:hypothetical protein
MELALSRNMTSKHLEFSEIIDASDVASLPNNIPRDLTPSAYVTFVDALDLGLGLSEARSAAGITTETAVAIATGTYDRWDTTFYVLHDRIKNKPPVLETREEIAPETYSPEIMAWLRQIS